MSFDPYHAWLGIAPHERPINHYRLLGLTLFESDEQTILAAADRLMGYVRTFQSGRRASESQQILNELSTAKTCLLNAHTKATYDAVLHGQLAAAPWDRSPDLSEPPAPPEPTPPEPPAAVNPSSDETRAGQQTYPTPTPFYFQPWFPVLLVAGVSFAVLGVWGIGTMIGHAMKDTAPAPAATPTARADESIEPNEDDALPDGAVLIMQEAGGELNFTAATALLTGSPHLIVRDAAGLITDITSPEDALAWHFQIEHPSAFRIEATYATEPGAAGGEFVVAVDDDAAKPITTRDTGGADSFTSERVGFLWIRRSGRHRLTLTPVKLPSAGSLMTLQSLRLIPVRGTASPTE